MAGDDIDDPGGDARLLGQHRQRQRAERRFCGGFDDDSATGGQRRARLAGDHGYREIPRSDGGDHAHRLLDGCQPAIAAKARDGAAIGALALLGEPLDKAGAIGHLALGLGQRLALLAGHDAGQLVAVSGDGGKPGVELVAALLGGQRRPGRLRCVGCRDGAAGILGIHVGHLGNDGTAGGVGDLEGAAAGGLAPLSIYIGAGCDQAGVGCCS